MKGIKGTSLLNYCEKYFDELFILESVIKLTKDACLEKEFGANYYEISKKNKKALSEERNHYINLLTIALDKVENLKSININMETEIGVTLISQQ